MDCRLTLDLNPREITTAQQKGACIIGGHIRFFTKKTVADSMRRIRQALVRACDDCNIPIDKKPRIVAGKWVTSPTVGPTIRKPEPVRVELRYYFPFPSGTPLRRQVEGEYMIERPDTDNLSKSVLDVLTDMRFWEDDSQVASLHATKMRTVDANRPRVEIRICTLRDHTDYDPNECS